MLGKLIKHDLIQGFHTVANVYLAALIAAGLMLVGILMNSPSIKALSSLALVVIMTVLLFFTFFAVAAMFSKSLFGNTGYLTLTLPVKEWELVFSKTFTGVLFILISYLAFTASFIGVYFYVSGQQGAQAIMQFWQMLQSVGFPGKETLLSYLIIKFILGLITILFTVSNLHIAVSLMNVSKLDRFGTFGGIVAFFVLTGVLRGIASRIAALVNFKVVILGKSFLFTFSDAFVAEKTAQGAMAFELSQYAVILVFALLSCFAANLLIKKQINVK